jgi:hypothetical protein
MTEFLLRTSPTEIAAAAPTVLFDAFAGIDPASSVQLGSIPTTPRASFVDLPVVANDLLWLAIAVLGADTTAPRASTADGWTRDLQISVPLADQAWPGARADVERMLNFLTGDRWTVQVVDVAPRRMSILQPHGDVACLLSGGLDSLCGAIDLLAGDPALKVVLVGSKDSGTSASRQIDLGEELVATFPGRVEQQRTRATFRRPSPSQERQLPAERENTSRSRSLYFIAEGLARAALLGPNVPLYVPENGVIGINVPISPSRVGSLSTRTTHPFFLSMLRRVLDHVGIRNLIRNPYRLSTKGEALAQSRNLALLRRLAPMSVSCAHPSALRYRGCAGPCGYCYPCLIRRASLHAIGADGPAGYCIDVLSEPGFVHARSETNASLLAVLSQLRRQPNRTDVLRTGPVDPDEIAAFAAVHRRGVAELAAWLNTATDPDLRALLP